ncbi:MAG: mechanosensitive ion channel family protein [Chloroflexota bacterium]
MDAILSTVLLEGLTIADLALAVGTFSLGVLAVVLERQYLHRLVMRIGPQRRFNVAQDIITKSAPLVHAGVLALASYLAVTRLPIMDSYLNTVHRVYVVAGIAIPLAAALRVQNVLFARYAKALARRKQTRMLASVVPLLNRSATIALVAIALLITLAQLGVQIAPLLAGLGIGGLAVALALQSTLSNFFAGISLLSDGSLQVGDLVELEDGMRGYVEEIGWRATRMRTFDNNVIIYPNSRLSESKTISYTISGEEVTAFVGFGVSYYTDLRHAERVIVEVMRESVAVVDGAVKEFEPAVWFTGFGDSNIEVRTSMQAHTWFARYDLISEFIKRLTERFRDEGIEISFPARNLWVRDARGGYALAGDARTPTPSQGTGLLPTDDAVDHEGDGDGD